MPRCVPAPSTRRRQLIGLALSALACAAPPARAQELVQRPFPAQALRGTLKVIAAPEVLLDGRPARLAPGARIRGPQNLLVMSAAITGQTLPVHYTRDFDGLLKDLWILRPDEVARFWPRSAAEAARYRFDPVAQTWSR
ncbi:MAG: hypothetical protein L6Q75_14710 [Burkholderiaceae bacterium]|nr:hypothetical protein [Burkholderiaceae bacterium]